MAVVIVRDEKDWGIYLGCALGIGFWSRSDCGEQFQAVVFENEKAARAHIDEWRPVQQQELFRCVSIPGTHKGRIEYASIENLVSAGLAPMLGEMGTVYLRYAASRGRA
jgi:hypothetical protein